MKPSRMVENSALTFARSSPKGCGYRSLASSFAGALREQAQIFFGVGAVYHRRGRHRPLAVPEPVEHFRQVPDNRTGRSDIEVAKVEHRIHLEVVVAHVAPADDRQRVVQYYELVMHSMIDAIEVGEEAENLREAMRKGVEYADLDVRVRVERREIVVAVLEVDIIDQDTNPHAAIGGPEQMVGKDAARGVLLPQKVLDVRGSFRRGRPVPPEP